MKIDFCDLAQASLEPNVDEVPSWLTIHSSELHIIFEQSSLEKTYSKVFKKVFTILLQLINYYITNLNCDYNKIMEWVNTKILIMELGWGSKLDWVFLNLKKSSWVEKYLKFDPILAMDTSIHHTCFSNFKDCFQRLVLREYQNDILSYFFSFFFFFSILENQNC